jgi:hypothetical protein
VNAQPSLTPSASQPPPLTGQQVPIPLDHWDNSCVLYLLLLISDDGVHKQYLLVTSIAGNLMSPFLPPVDSTLDTYKTTVKKFMPIGVGGMSQ